MKQSIQPTVLLMTIAAFIAAPAAASDWPKQPITIVVPFSAGGPTDFIARLVAEPLAKKLGQPVIVQNKPGASGNVGYKTTLAERANGYTLLHNTVGMQALNPLMYPALKMNPASDYTTVGITGTMPNLLVVNPDKVKADSVKALVDLAKTESLTYATFGMGTSPHVYGSLLQKHGGFKALQIPYKGSSNAMTDIIAGQVDYLFDSFTTSIGQVTAGKLKALAITGQQRSALLPDVPTLEEAGFASVDLKFWFSLQAPAKTPAAVITKLRTALYEIAQSPEYQKALEEKGAAALPTAPQVLDAFVQKETTSWEETAQDIGIEAR